MKKAPCGAFFMLRRVAGLLRHQHAVDHVDHAVALADVGGGHLRGAALGVGQGDATGAVRGGGIQFNRLTPGGVRCSAHMAGVDGHRG